MLTTTKAAVAAMDFVFTEHRREFLAFSSRSLFREYVNRFYKYISNWYDELGSVVLFLRNEKIDAGCFIKRCKITLWHITYCEGYAEFKSKWRVPKECIKIMITDCITWQDSHMEVRFDDDNHF